MVEKIELRPFITTRERPKLFEPTHAEILDVLGKYPDAIGKTTFNEKGLVEIPEGLLVPVYVASGHGFTTEGTKYLNEDLYPKLRKNGIFPLCPFAACAEFLPKEVFDTSQTVADLQEKWKKFNKDIVDFVNYGILMRFAKFMFADLNGFPPDEGVTAELSFFASNYGPVIGMRSDFRLAENPAASINPAISAFMNERYNGFFFTGSSAYERAIKKASEIASEIRGS